MAERFCNISSTILMDEVPGFALQRMTAARPAPAGDTDLPALFVAVIKDPKES